MGIRISGLLLVSLCSVWSILQPASAAFNDPDKMIEYANEPWTGDLDGILERRFLRILTVHNPLLFSFDGVKQKGMVAELSKLYEKHLNETIGRVRAPTVVVIPVSRDELLPGLMSGRGDLVMGNLTITPERQKQIDFGPPVQPNVEELVITGPAAGKVESLDDLVEWRHVAHGRSVRLFARRG